MTIMPTPYFFFHFLLFNVLIEKRQKEGDARGNGEKKSKALYNMMSKWTHSSFLFLLVKK